MDPLVENRIAALEQSMRQHQHTIVDSTSPVVIIYNVQYETSAATITPVAGISALDITALATAVTEVESSLVCHESVAVAGVVGAADAMTGQGIVAFVILRGGIEHANGEDLVTQLRNHVTKEIGAIARPRQILVVAELPKTRSGKIMRRLLKDVAENRVVGDATTLADPNVMKLIKEGLNTSKDEN